MSDVYDALSASLTTAPVWVQVLVVFAVFLPVASVVAVILLRGIDRLGAWLYTHVSQPLRSRLRKKESHA